MRLYNTLSGTLEEFVPRDAGKVGLYVCGPTVQSEPHFGHARAAILPDVLRRYLQWRGLDVLHVRNVTDIDDKIIKRAAQEGRSPFAVAEQYTRVYDQQMARLGVLPPHIAPRATGHLSEMIELIQRLIDVGSAYAAGGDVFFSVRSFAAYGKLSGRKVDELRAGARIEPDERKQDPADFALWKAAKPGEPSWPSPWGRGRPGWHIECSAMATRHLGEAFDIHTGGLDLVFPHHENEIAQAEAASGTTFAKIWLHNGLLDLDGEKMSKSLGNVVSLSDALSDHGPDVVRMYFLAADYRSPMELSPQRLDEAAAALGRWQGFLRLADALPVAAGQGGGPAAQTARERFVEAMENDLSTPGAHAALFDLVTAGHAALAAGDTDGAAGARDTLRELCEVLGYELTTQNDTSHTLVAPLVGELLALRAQARDNRDFATADGIRQRLAALGITVEDSADGARWHHRSGIASGAPVE